MLYVGSLCTGASLVFLFPSYLWALVAGLGPFFSFLHDLELSDPHCLDHGAIWLSLPPFLAGDFYLSPILFPRQHSQPGAGKLWSETGALRWATVTQQPVFQPPCHKQCPLVPCWHRMACKGGTPYLPVQLCLHVHMVWCQASKFRAT